MTPTNGEKMTPTKPGIYLARLIPRPGTIDRDPELVKVRPVQTGGLAALRFSTYGGMWDLTEFDGWQEVEITVKPDGAGSKEAREEIARLCDEWAKKA